MNSKEIYDNLYHKGGIYGYMYGKRLKQHPIEEDIIFIPQKDLEINILNNCFIYVWGWPGPDYNIYYVEDYGKTWSFCREDLINSEEINSGIDS